MMSDKIFNEIYNSKASVTKVCNNIISPWITIAEKEVLFCPEDEKQTYHSLILSDYVSVLARTPSGMIPVVRQFRPAVEQYTWELPAGLVNFGEKPETAAKRELEEEARVKTNDIKHMGTTFVDTGRLNNRVYMFYVECSEPIPEYQEEKGIEIKFIKPEELKQAIITSEFDHQIHIASLFMATLHGFKWDR